METLDREREEGQLRVGLSSGPVVDHGEHERGAKERHARGPSQNDADDRQQDQIKAHEEGEIAGRREDFVVLELGAEACEEIHLKHPLHAKRSEEEHAGGESPDVEFVHDHGPVQHKQVGVHDAQCDEHRDDKNRRHECARHDG